MIIFLYHMKQPNKSKINNELGKLVYFAKNNLQKLQDVLDYEPKYFSQKINFEKTSQEVISNNPDEIIHIYLGKIAKDERLREGSIYNDNFILWIIEEVLERAEYENKLEIHLGPDVSRYFNGNKDVERYMNIDEEIEYIKTLLASKKIKKKYRKRASRIVYKDLCDTKESGEHHKLFSALEDSWMDEIYKDIKPVINTQNINSLTLSQYLWRVYNHNSKFKQQIRNIVPKRLKTWNQSVYLYPIVEIAIRLTDFLQGNHIQWWANKQYDYDRVVNMILFNEDLKSQLPELSELQNILKQYNEYGNFQTFYFNTKGFAEHQKEKTKSSKLKSKIRTTALVIAGLFTAFWSWRYFTLKSIRQEKQDEITEIFKNTMINSDVPLEEIDKKTNTIYNIFNEIYGEQPWHEKEFKALIKSVIMEYENDETWKYDVDFYSAHPDHFYAKPKYFIEKAIVSKYAILLKERNYELIKNKRLWGHEVELVNSLEKLEQSGNISTKKNVGDRVMMWWYETLDVIGTIDNNEFSEYTIAKRKGDNYVLTSKDYYNNEGVFSLETTKETILLYIKQTYPVIESMAHKIRYNDRFGKGTEDERDDYKAIKLELFSYFIKTGKIKTLRERRPYGQYDWKQQMHYVDEFAKENPQFMRKHNLSELPGERLLKEKQAIYNSIQIVKNNKSKFRDSLRTTDNNLDQNLDKNRKYIWLYLMSNGEEYSLFKIKHNHKEYIVPYSYQNKAGWFSLFNKFYKDRKQARAKFWGDM